MSDHPFGISDYFHDLEILARSDLSTADKELLKALRSSWETLNCQTLKEQIENSPIRINLFVEDKVTREGPFLFSCVPSWTGKTLKEKIAFFLKFPIEFQTLLVDYRMIKDDKMLKSYNIVKEGDEVTVFLINKISTDIGINLSTDFSFQEDVQPGPSGLQNRTSLPRIHTNPERFESDSD